MTASPRPHDAAEPVRSDEPKVEAPVPAAEGRPGLVEAAELRKRLDSVQGSIQKSVLALLAILAFWLAIENSYHGYSTLIDLRQKETFLSKQLGRSDTEIKKLVAVGTRLQSSAASRPAIPASSPQSPTATVGAVASESSGTLEQLAAAAQLDNARQQLAAEKIKRDELKDRARKLQQEALELSVLGTKIASRLVVAPLVCLVAFLFWLNYFTARRAMAHGLIAALHMQLPTSQRHFGAATSGTMWLTPLPDCVRIQGGGERVHVAEREHLRWLLGWTVLAESRQLRALRTFAFLCVVVVLRIGFIAIDLTSPTAVKEEFVSPEWRWPAALTAGALTLIGIVKLLFLTRAGSDDVEGAQVALPDRRELATTALTLALAGMAAAYVNRSTLASTLASAKQALLADSTATDRQKRGLRLQPRFLALAERLRRRANRNTVRVVLRLKSTFVRSPPRRDRTFSIHFADREGRVRLRAAAAAAPKFEEVVPRQIDGWLQSAQGKLRLNPRRTWPFEAYALDRLERGQVQEACEALLLGIRLTLQSGVDVPINMRLLDLLAGLAVRSGNGTRYLEALVTEVRRYIDRLRQSGFLQVQTAANGSGPGTAQSFIGPAQQVSRTLTALEQRIAKWQPEGSTKNAQPGARWRMRWSASASPRPMWWHHPFELRTAPLPALISASTAPAASRPTAPAAPITTLGQQGKENLARRLPVLTPEVRQREALRRQRPVRLP